MTHSSAMMRINSASTSRSYRELRSPPMGPDELPYSGSPRKLVKRAMPQTALGLAGVLFLMSIAAAFSGAVLYAYYESRQEATNNKVESFFRDYNKSIEDASKTIQAEGDRAKADIRNQLDELQ